MQNTNIVSVLENVCFSYFNSNIEQSILLNKILNNPNEYEDCLLFKSKKEDTSNEEGYSLVHYICKHDHNEILKYFICRNNNKFLIVKTTPSIKYYPKCLPIEIAVKHEAKKCLEEFFLLEPEDKLLILRNLDEKHLLSRDFIKNFIQNIKHHHLLNALDDISDSFTINFPKDIRSILESKKELFYESILNTIKVTVDVTAVIKYVNDNQFELKSKCGTNILIDVLNMEKKENYLSDRSLNFLKIAAFLVVKGVNYSFNSKNPFTDIPQLDHNKSNKIREFVSKLLTHNRNETPRILSFSTDPKNIHQEAKETVKKAISETYCTLYCDNKYFSEEEDYFRPIMDVVICGNLKIECDADITKIAFPANNNDKGLADIINNKIFFSFNGNDTETRGTIIHEFCHMANYMLYNNQARPYKKEDIKTKDIYLRILNELKKKENLDELIKLAWSKVYTTEEDQVAELAVRVPHMLAKYGYKEGIKFLNEQTPELLALYKENFLKDCSEFLINKKSDLFLLKSTFNRINTISGSLEESLAQARLLMSELKFKEAIEFFNKALRYANDEYLVKYIFNQKSTCERMIIMFDLQSPITDAYLVSDLHLFLDAFRQARHLVIEQKKFYEGMKWVHVADNCFLKCKKNPDNHPILAEFIIFKAELFTNISISELSQIEYMSGCSKDYQNKAKTLIRRICNNKKEQKNTLFLFQFKNNMRNYALFIKEHPLIVMTGTVTAATLVAMIYKKKPVIL
ncbi:MAG: hypothetical protein ACR2HS_04520 [Gammaproteobacteria bacterium]